MQAKSPITRRVSLVLRTVILPVLPAASAMKPLVVRHGRPCSGSRCTAGSCALPYFGPCKQICSPSEPPHGQAVWLLISTGVADFRQSDIPSISVSTLPYKERTDRCIAETLSQFGSH